MDEGRLVLVATPIGNLGDLAPRAVEVLRDADVIAAEDTRRTRALLTHAGLSASGRLVAVHEHNERGRAAELVDEIRRGGTVALVTDAGMPGVSDPGALVVRACVDAGVRVDVVPGPSAALAALVVSGLPTDRFAFEGFLPKRDGRRRKRLAALKTEERTTVYCEAARRVKRLLEEMLDLWGDRDVVVCRELTKRFETTLRGKITDVLAQIGDHELKGETVVVVAGAGEEEDERDDEAART